MVIASSLYDIFYRNNKTGLDQESLNSLRKYMLTKDFTIEFENNMHMKPIIIETAKLSHEAIPSIIIDPPVLAPPKPIIIEKKMPMTKTFIPESKNTLFWSVFIGNYGYEEYLAVNGKFLNKEIEEKQKIVAFFNNNKKLKMSNHKLTNAAMQEIIADLSVIKDELYSNLVAYSIFYEKTIFLLMNHSYYIFNAVSETLSACSEINMENTIVITMQPRKNHRQRIFGVQLNMTSEELAELLKTRILLEHYNKPLRGVSSYKSDELDAMFRKIQSLGEIQNQPSKLKKADMYTYITEKIMEDVSSAK